MLDLYRDTPFDSTTILNGVFVGVGDGTTTVFTLPTELTNLTIGSYIQVGSSVLLRPSQWGISGSTVTFATAPALSAVITFSGLSALLIPVYDQDPVTGVTNPRIKEIPFYLFDENINAFGYEAAFGKSGIEVELLDADTSNGSALSWYQLAKALADGTPDTYGTAGDPVYFDNIEFQTTLSGPYSAGATAITLADASGLQVGWEVSFGLGTGNKEDRRIAAISGNIITVSALGFSHPDAENVYHSGIKGWIKTTCPLNAAGNVPTNLRDVYPQLTFESVSRF